MYNAPFRGIGSPVSDDPDHMETEELVELPALPQQVGSRHVCADACEHTSSLVVQEARIDREAGVLSARLQAHVELAATDCFCIQEARLRLRLRFRFQGLQHAERVVQFLSTFDEACTYRETADGVGKVIDVETECWDLTPQETTVFDHQDHVLVGGHLQTWYLPYERVCFDLGWPLDLPTHRVASATFLLSPLLHYRLGRNSSCTHDHVRGLGDFYVRPRRRTRVGLI